MTKSRFDTKMFWEFLGDNTLNKAISPIRFGLDMSQISWVAPNGMET